MLGDFPTFDYTLEAELGSDNLRYIGPKASMQQYDSIAPIYNAQVLYLSERIMLVISQYGLQFSIIFDEAGMPKILPVVSTDKNEALWPQQKVNSVELLSESENKFVVLLGSTYNDSYIV